jgi:hypothetical protein
MARTSTSSKPMITNREIDQAFSDLRCLHGGVREDIFGLIYPDFAR